MRGTRRQQPRPRARLSARAAILAPIVVGFTVGALDSVLNPGLGFLTGVVVMATSIFIASSVARRGLFWAAVLPPVTMLCASASAAVFGLGEVSVLSSLSANAFLTLAATAVATTIALVRFLAPPRPWEPR